MPIKRTNKPKAKATKNDEFKYEIIENYGTISIDDNWELKLRKISWNGQEPKYDLRKWRDTDDGERSGKGCSLTEDQLFDLRDFLNNILDDGDED